jgi:DNA repair photolyase
MFCRCREARPPEGRTAVVTVIRARRKSPVLTPSGLACLSTLPTINLTTGCLHDCLYCYIRGYRNYPGEGRIVLYDNTLDLLRDELSRMVAKPRAVYFSPSSDLFQPAPEVLGLSDAILQFLFSQGVGVAFLTKGVIPDCTLQLLIEHRDSVRAQIGLITLDEGISRVFEPHAASPQRRLRQLEALIAGGVQAEARLDPILPGVTDSAESVDEHLASLARVGVRRIAAGVLFLRPGILYWLKSAVADRQTLGRLLHVYQGGQQTVMRGAQYPVLNLPTEARREIFDRLGRAAAAHGVEVKICACKNADLARGSCNIAGAWPRRSPDVVQPLLVAV